MPAHTHYDNLKVARNAPPEVIRAAYKTLSQEFHPDRNPGNSECARIMAILNTSYDVLSNPEKRRLHDIWISQEERASTRAHSAVQPMHAPQPPPSMVMPTQDLGVGWRILVHVFEYWFLYGIAAAIVFAWAVDKPEAPAQGPKPYVAQPSTLPAPAPPTAKAYVRPAFAPNGSPWPSIAGYISGYKRLNGGGLSTVTVDNTQNDSEVFVKLVSLDGAQAYPARQFYIPAFGTFTLGKVRAGSYDVRYRDLTSGGLSRSDAFNIDEIRTDEGVQFSRFTMTLYKVRNGNMNTHSLAEDEF